MPIDAKAKITRFRRLSRFGLKPSILRQDVSGVVAKEENQSRFRKKGRLSRIGIMNRSFA